MNLRGRLQQIGYCLILGVSASVFAASALAADCKVNDPDISAEYVGGCLNGLAHGKGKAKGMDTYDGEFKLGSKDGYGKYTWSVGVVYQGNYSDDRRNGFGKLTIPRSLYDSNKVSGKGKWIGDNYVENGMFERATFVLFCTSPQNCKQEQANREAQERREAADRERDKATACNKYYTGYVGYVDYNNGKRDFWGQDIGNKYGRFVVLGSGGGSVSIKGVDGGSYPGYDKMDNVSCAWLREKER